MAQPNEEESQEMTLAESAPMPLVDAALAYRTAGHSVIAARNKQFAGGMEWGPFKHAPATDEQIGEMFMRQGAEQVAIICGAVSGNLECLDFDAGGERYPAWREMIDETAPGLVDRLPMEMTPSGGRHILYRCPDTVIPGVQKLAMRPAKSRDEKPECLIETRGEGAYFVCSPSPGYALIQGELTAIPAITPAERDALLHCAGILDERIPEKPISRPVAERGPIGDIGRPGDDYNRRGNVREVLFRHGWQHIRTVGPNEQWRRPGKEDRGISATLRLMDGVEKFYVFTSSTIFEPGEAYAPFQVLAILEHNGDFSATAAELRRQGYGAVNSSHSDNVTIRNDDDRKALAKGLEAKDAATWILEPIPPSDPIIEGIFDVGDKCFLVGGSKGRKSFFTMQTALSIATGKDFLGFHIPKARRVAIAQFEIREHHYQRRLRRMTTAMWLNPNELQGRLLIFNLRGKSATLEALGDCLKPLSPELLIIDPWYKLYGQGHDENSAGDAAALLARVDKLAEELGAAIWICHHDTKSGAEKATSRGAGSGLVSRDYDACLLLTPHASESDAVVLSAVLRNNPPMRETAIRWSDNRFIEAMDILPTPETPITRRSKVQRGPSDEEIIDVVTGWFAGAPIGSLSLQSRIHDDFNIGEKRVERVVAMMVESGKYTRRRNPEHGRYEIVPQSCSAGPQGSQSPLLRTCEPAPQVGGSHPYK